MALKCRKMVVGNNNGSFLTFQLLEDVMGLPPLERERHIGQSKVFRLGPLVEYIYHNYEDALSCLRIFPDVTSTKLLTTALSLSSLSNSPQNPSLFAKAVEFFRPPQVIEQFEDPRWDAFHRRLQEAAKTAGFSSTYSQGLAGTFGEMVSNLFGHSDYPETGIVGYRWCENEFEYVVADRGIGVLASLREHPNYSGLLDSGQALQTALAEGESRHGKFCGHGMGFRSLLLNIASRNSYLRFRSGDHSLVLNGVNQSTERSIRPCEEFQGFLISVVCKMPGR